MKSDFGFLLSVPFVLLVGLFVSVGPCDAKTTDGQELSREAYNKRRIICIDAGHQRHGNNEKEPDGPGSTVMKAKVSSGTSGKTTGLPEYELNLEVSLKLKKELLERGYKVVMTRESNNVNISNAERAAVANLFHSDAFLRIHADGADNSSTKGAMTICQTKNNPYNGHLYFKSSLLSKYVLAGLCEAAGTQSRSVWETDTMSGINWAEVPVTIVEMGFMSNPEEDVLMASEEYQNKLSEGIADGVDKFFEMK